MKGTVKYSGYKRATNKMIRGLKNNRRSKREIVRSIERNKRIDAEKSKKIDEYKTQNENNRYEQ